MATTQNNGWPTPDDADNVKDGAAAIRALGDAIDADMPVRQVVTALFADLATITSTAGFTDTPMAVSITPQQPDSLLLVEATFQVEYEVPSTTASTRHGAVQLWNDTDSAQLAHAEVGTHKHSGDAGVEIFKTAVALAGVYTVDSTTERTFRVRGRTLLGDHTLRIGDAISSYAQLIRVTELRP